MPATWGVCRTRGWRNSGLPDNEGMHSVDIKDGATQLPGVQRIGQSLLVDHQAAADVDEDKIRIRPHEQLPVDQVPGLIRISGQQRTT